MLAPALNALMLSFRLALGKLLNRTQNVSEGRHLYIFVAPVGNNGDRERFLAANQLSNDRGQRRWRVVGKRLGYSFAGLDRMPITVVFTLVEGEEGGGVPRGRLIVPISTVARLERFSSHLPWLAEYVPHQRSFADAIPVQCTC